MAVEDSIQQAIAAGKGGDRAGAVRLLSEAVRQDPGNARAWYLLSQVVEGNEKARYCLEKVLEIDPGNEQAVRRLNELESKSSESKKKGGKNLLWIVVGAVAVVCCIFVFLVGAYIASNGEEKPTEVAVSVPTSKVAEATMELLSSATNTLPPTDTKIPTLTFTATASKTPVPSFTPAPTDTPTIVPTPHDISGVGDAVIDIPQFDRVGVLYIVGNAGSQHFSVKNYAADGDYIDLLVNTTEPYNGYRPINLWRDKQTVRLEITSEGPWNITLLPLVSEYVHVIAAPGIFTGTGDDVLMLQGGGGPWVAKISGNAGSNHFAVKSYGYEGYDLLVNTTDPYDGTTLTSDGIILFVVDAVGGWTIELSK